MRKLIKKFDLDDDEMTMSKLKGQKIEVFETVSRSLGLFTFLGWGQIRDNSDVYLVAIYTDDVGDRKIAKMSDVRFVKKEE